MVVNPNLVRAQIEGGIGLALTTTLKTRITFTNGATDQSNFTDYPLLSMEEMPRIVSVIESVGRAHRRDAVPESGGHREIPAV